MKIDPDYIRDIPHTPTNKLKKIGGMDFVGGLEEVYGKEKVQTAMKGLFAQSDKAYTGVKAFKERLTKAIIDNAELSPEDQVYINNEVKKIVDQQLHLKPKNSQNRS